MFVQVVRGVVADPAATFARLDDWLERLAPGAAGWLGTTAGVTADGELVSFVRFASAADARRSSDRVEQGLWWAGSVLLFTGDVVFDNYDDVELVGDGGADGAGTVEVLLGRTRRGRSAQELGARLAALTADPATGAIGGLLGHHDDGQFTHALWFCRSVSARAEPVLDPRSLRAGRLVGVDVRVLRLQSLWFGSPERAGRPA
ncbi:hypothetical protein SAMN04488543_0228 [Friedmanniella luteola]|uniref:Antibiotic biosynthesis monooxygenase n=1 Tax=Friedmanniella luteola TaxID=546871 RepID=A0A1H1LDP3_9ACTN|nr:hypothetical protein [Friedmanniella luteola]SDR72668.1 hypothetical protein SAMN04488543_0228 [Friedmanniella luteola]